jgi:hypothetical protein
MSRARADFNRTTPGHTQRIESSKIRARSRLVHSSSHRPTLVFHDPFCLKNAGRRTPSGSAFHPKGQPASVGRPEFEPSNFFAAWDRTLVRAVQSSPARHLCPESCSLGIQARQVVSSPWAAEMATRQRLGRQPEIDCEQRRRVVWSPCRCLRSRQLVRRESGPRTLGSPSPSRTDDWVLSLVGDSDETER